jgi:hypothetical protein
MIHNKHHPNPRLGQANNTRQVNAVLAVLGILALFSIVLGSLVRTS